MFGQRMVLGVSYAGNAYFGWQSQTGGNTVQDQLQKALKAFCGGLDAPAVVCAGRTDSGVHALMQVVHFDTSLQRDMHAWVRGTNRFLPPDIAVQWAAKAPADFHARACATSRRYSYILLAGPVRPSIDAGRVGWINQTLDGAAMQLAAQQLLGEHDFSSFRASECQALSPVKTMLLATVTQRGAYWRFDFEASAFLHHMIRNIMGCLVAVGQAKHPPEWLKDVLAAKNRRAAAPTFSADGLYFLGPQYAPHWLLPSQTPAFDWLPS